MLIACATFAVKNELSSMLNIIREFKESFNERLIMKRSFFLSAFLCFKAGEKSRPEKIPSNVIEHVLLR